MEPGEYDLEVSAPSYKTYDEWHTLAPGEQELTIKLGLEDIVVPEPQPVSTVPEPAMVRIEGGCFQMGSPASEEGRDSDERQHRLCVDDFYLGKYELTVAEFRRFIQAIGYRTDAERNAGGVTGCYAYDKDDPEKQWNWRGWADWKNPNQYQSNRDNYPVACVSWNDAVAYLEWLAKETGRNYRLPTEAEWEYAVRAGTQSARYWGNDPDAACRYANVADQTKYESVSWNQKHECSDSYFFVAPVGRFQPNAWGLYDMLGNLWEWTCSSYREGYDGAEGRCDHRSDTKFVPRGGSWNFYPHGVRSANRTWINPAFRANYLGFRPARPPVNPGTAAATAAAGAVRVTMSPLPSLAGTGAPNSPAKEGCAGGW